MRKPADLAAFIAFAVVLLGSTKAIGGELPFVPFPPNVTVVVVGEDIKVNGLPLMAYEFNSAEPADKVAGFYRAIWKESIEKSDADGVPFLETKIQNWLVISRLEKGHNITIQIEKSALGTTHALVGISPLPKFAKENRKNIYEVNIPKLSGMEIVSIVASSDGGRESQIYWIDSNRNIESTLEEFKRFYDAHEGLTKGYRVETNPPHESDYGILRVTTETASLRFDAMKMADKTRVIALWRPH